MADLNPDTDYLLDVFGGADGGVSFARLKVFIAALEAQAAEGDSAAAELLQIQARYVQLVKIAQRS